MTVPSHSDHIQHSPKGSFHLGLQPAPAWTAIIGLALFTILGILGGAKVLNLAFPAASFAVSIFLYRRYPVLYMGFTWWIWFLSPLIRRLIDYRAGFSDQSLILMTPPLVVLITIPSLIQYIWKHYPYNRLTLPFILAFVGVFYSFSLGLTTPLSEGSNIFLITRGSIIPIFVQWIAPISFGFFILSNWRNYPSFRDNIKLTFFWGGLVMGSYGLLQFFMMPAWDEAWQQEAIKVGFGNAIGSIWSTVNSPGAFATILIPCLLLLLGSQSSLRIPLAIVLILDILLTNNRTASIAGFAGFILFAGNLKPALQMRLTLVLLVIVMLIFPLANMGVFPDLFNRIQTISNIQGDGSFQARQNVYENLTETALINPIGYGMGSLPLADSGILVLFYELGWLGIVPFLSGLILLFLNIRKNSMSIPDDSFRKAALASSYAILIMVPNGNLFTSLGGLLIWSFPSLIMAGNQYYQHQKKLSALTQ